ncbi:hypothetical protein [Kribbella sp. CA-247076]|uniref:hypothetical protein n=1 Tax=Kribbella sp. CA-247076 TaxID=3239941 RepID=UPI003D9418BF
MYGFDVSLDDYDLRVSVGLAQMTDGRPLRTTAVLSARIDNLALTAGRYFEVGLKCGSWPHGDEAVQGLLCDAPCASDGGTRRTARAYEGPYLVIEPVDSETELAQQVSAHRSWLASRLFRREEDQARRFTSSLPAQWTPNVAERARDVVPLALLLPPMGGFDWQVDQWSVRRDKGAPPPARYWEWQLGMRPRDVFIAQVLQFQVQLNDIPRGTDLHRDVQTLTASMKAAEDLQPGEQLDEALGELGRKLTDLTERLSGLEQAPPRAAGESPGPEFVELPPAGFVPCTGVPLEGIGAAVEYLLDCPGYVRKVCTCAPGDIGARFAAAQHRDRIVTPRSSNKMAGVIDVFVPVLNGEPAYDWVLFTRAEEVECPEPEQPEPALDLVAVKVQLENETVEDLGSLTYPARAWQVPEDGAEIFARVRGLIGEQTLQTVRADVTSDDRRPLGYLRAVLLAGTFLDNHPAVPPPVETAVAADQPETITVVLDGPIDNIAKQSARRPSARKSSSAQRSASATTAATSKASTRPLKAAASEKTAVTKPDGKVARKSSTTKKSPSPKSERR